MPSRSRLYILISSFFGLLIVLTVVYIVGLARGRGDLQEAVEDAAATAQAQALLDQIVATATPTPTPTLTQTPTVTPTPSETPTPTPSPSPSPTPASPEEWADRFLQQSLLGLNALAGLEFTAERAEALLRNMAQQQSLIFAPVSHFTLSEQPWAALAVPRTPDGRALPMLFWQEPNDQNRVRGQLLLDQFSEPALRSYAELRAGLQHGVMRSDEQGRFHALLVERGEGSGPLPVWLLAQPAPGSDFSLIWSSVADPSWAADGASGSITLVEPESGFLPDLVVDAPLPAGSELRSVVRAPGTFVEQPPFARQWANSRWTPATFGDLNAGGAVTGYRLSTAGLRSTPLTSLAQVLALLQAGTVDNALTYATRLDVVQQAFDYSLNQPGWWVGVYLDDAGQEILDERTTSRLRFFDNGARNRTYDASFELDDSGFYKLAALTQAAAWNGPLLTPAAPLPTLSPTPEPTGTPTPAPTNATPTPSPTALPVGAPTPTPTRTPTSTPAPTPAPTAVPPSATPTETASPTITPTPTETLTPSPTPYQLPPVDPQAVAVVTGVTNVVEPARLRAGPGQGFPVILPLGNGVQVGLFGITQAQDWYLIRVDAPGHPNLGQLGWIFRDLVSTVGDLAQLPVYDAAGLPLTPLPVTPTAVGAAPGSAAGSAAGGELAALLATPTPEPTATPTPTPLQTPQIQLPSAPPPSSAAAPAPDADETVLTVAGARLPARPLQPVQVTAADGRLFALRVDAAEVALWSGLLAAPTPTWLAAPAELLWPGATLHVRLRSPLPDGAGGELPAQEEGADPAAVEAVGPLLVADRVHIASAPAGERAALEDASAWAAAVTGDPVALVGGVDTAGVNLLPGDGDVTPLWPQGAGATWLDGSDSAGLLVPLRSGRYGSEGFIWARTDGSGLRINAQPYFAVSGIAGDAFIGLWWIERPLVNTGRWQLWQWDPQTQRIVLRYEAGDDLLSSAGTGVAQALLPRVVAALPAQPGDASRISLWVDSAESRTQAPNQGLFALTLVAQEGDARTLEGAPRLVLEPGEYMAPLAFSPARDRLAFSQYDPGVPSLTAGQVRPANRIRVLNVATSTLRTIYQTENNLEFIAPLLTWQDENTLLTARSRFAAGGAGLDLFGAVWIELEEGAEGDRPGGTSVFTVNIPGDQALLDVAGCRSDESTLLVLLNEDGSLEYARWTGFEPIRNTFTVPNNLTRAFTCWRVPTE